MGTEKRRGLLTDTERERLINREEEDAKTRCNTDLKVRKKLTTWVEAIPDVELSLFHLPPNQINAIVEDADIFRLLEMAEKLMSLKEFLAVTGRIDEEHWTDSYGNEAKDLDIYRGFNIFTYTNQLQEKYLGHPHPFAHFDTILNICGDEMFKDRIKPEEKRGMERIGRAILACGAKFPREFPRDEVQLYVDVLNNMIQKRMKEVDEEELSSQASPSRGSSVDD